MERTPVMDPTDPPLPDNVVDITAQRREAVRAGRTPWEGDEGRFAIDRTTASAIAHIVHKIRPDWSLIEIMAALEACKTMEVAYVTVAAVRAAGDERFLHPSRIPHAGPHWPRDGEEPVMLLQSVSDIAKNRDTSQWKSHSLGFSMSRCRGYLKNCKDRGIVPDPLVLADYQAKGVDTEKLVSEIYQR